MVVTGKVAVVLPEDTATEAGTTAAGLLLERATTTPLAGAASFKVTVPTDEAPAVTVAGFRETPVMVTAGVIVRVADLVALL